MNSTQGFSLRAIAATGLVALLLGASGCSGGSEDEVQMSAGEEPVGSPVQATFTNPLNDGGPDPWVTWYEGNYYLAATTWGDAAVGLTMRRAATIAELKKAEPVQIWQDATPERCCNFWAPEFFLLDGPNGLRWYGYFTGGAAGEDYVRRQFMHVIESEGTDPMGPYHYMGKLVERNALDATVLQLNDKLYAVYSVWNETQDLAIMEMSSPWETVGEEVTLSKPTYPWEVQTHTVNEGPVAIHHEGRTFMVYAASACWGPDYKLGLLELVGGDPLDVESWFKYPEPVFERADDRGVFAPGHNTFFKSPDGTEDWMAYHANDEETDVCDMGRTPRIQKLTWNEDGTPNFGIPASESMELSVPSRQAGEPQP